MKKTTALFIIAIFVFSLVPLAFAEEGRTDASSETMVKEETKASDGTSGSKTDVRVRAQAKSDMQAARESAKEMAKQLRDQAKTAAESRRQANVQRLNVLKGEQKAKIEALEAEKLDRISNLSSERLQKIAELDKKQIERLSELNIKSLEKITELKKERLERISKLSEEKIERLSELEQDKLEKVSDLNDTEIGKFSALGRARLKEMAKLDREQLKAELKALKIVKVKSAEDLDERKISEEKIAELKDKFDKAKEDFKESKDELQDSRKKLNEAREKKDENATIEQAKNYLLKTSDVLISHLEKIKAKIQESKNIPEDNAAKIVAEIDTQITEINKIKADVQAAATKEQVKEAAKKLNEKWNKLKHLIRLHAERVVSARVEGLVNQGLVLEKRLDNILAKAKEKNVSIDVSAEISAFSGKVAASRDKYKQAQAKISDVLDLRAKGEPADSSGIKALMNDAESLLKEARQSVKEAHEILKTIVKKIKEAVPDADLSEESEVEVEVADETSASAAGTQANAAVEAGTTAQASN